MAGLIARHAALAAVVDESAAAVIAQCDAVKAVVAAGGTSNLAAIAFLEAAEDTVTGTDGALFPAIAGAQRTRLVDIRHGAGS